MISKNDIIFLVRSYNEWKIIVNTLSSIIDEGFINILLIDDGSTDNTYELIDKINKDNINLIYIKHTFNRWAWAALETWFEYLRLNKKFKYLVTFDADWQHNIKDIYTFLEYQDKNKNIDIVFGSRFLEKTNSNVPFIRRIILFWWKMFTSFFSWVRLTDSHNWYRMIKISILNKLKLSMWGMEYASELIDKVWLNNLKFWEVPVNIKYTDYSLSKGQSSLNAFNIAIKMIWNKFFK